MIELEGFKKGQQVLSYKAEIGIIKGFSYNMTKEYLDRLKPEELKDFTVVEVLFDNGQTRTLHPSLLTV